MDRTGVGPGVLVGVGVGAALGASLAPASAPMIATVVCALAIGALGFGVGRHRPPTRIGWFCLGATLAFLPLAGGDPATASLTDADAGLTAAVVALAAAVAALARPRRGVGGMRRRLLALSVGCAGLAALRWSAAFGADAAHAHQSAMAVAYALVLTALVRIGLRLDRRNLAVWLVTAGMAAEAAADAGLFLSLSQGDGAPLWALALGTLGCALVGAGALHPGMVLLFDAAGEPAPDRSSAGGAARRSNALAELGQLALVGAAPTRLRAEASGLLAEALGARALVRPGGVGTPAAPAGERAGSTPRLHAVVATRTEPPGTITVERSGPAFEPAEADFLQVFAAALALAVDRRNTEIALRRQAFRDPLTGLPNRALFLDRLEHSLAASGRSGDDLAVLFLDLDGFKEINDRYGHEAGDQVLIEVAARLAQVVRPGDTVARLGGDEFTVLCSDVGPGQADVVAARLADAVRAPMRVPGVSEAISPAASVGVTVIGEDEASAAALLARADEAMYRAKRAKRAGAEHGRVDRGSFEPLDLRR
ncbi:MAG: diguanylate cyclase domain-containing protein [Acidimicrobiales bacterium]